MIEFHFFLMPIKTLGSLGKIRVGRVTGNTHNFFFGLICVTSILGILLIRAQIVGGTWLQKYK